MEFEKSNILSLFETETTPLFMLKPERFSTLLDTEEVYDFGFEEMVQRLQHMVPLQKPSSHKAEELDESFFPIIYASPGTGQV